MIDGETLERLEVILDGRHPEKKTPLYAVEREDVIIFCDDSFLFQVPSEEVDDWNALDWLLDVGERVDGIEHAHYLKNPTNNWVKRYSPNDRLKICWIDPEEDDIEYFKCDLAVLEAAGERVFFCQAYLTAITLIFGRVYYKICTNSGRAWPLLVYKHRKPVGAIMNLLDQRKSR
jgi:hypothetical protein